MNTRELLEVALKAGEILLKSGAEIYRVEDTIVRILEKYKVQCECFVLLTGIFISAKGEDDDETISLVKHIKGYSTNLSRIELVNSFSRNLGKKTISYQEAMYTLEKIEKTPPYSFMARLFAAGATAFIYTLIFKGNVNEGLVALLISIIIYFIKEKISQIGFFLFFEFFVSGLIAGTMSEIAVKIFPELNIYKIIIGAIMILVPGVAITNGIKDALHGDTVSSLYRFAEAIFISVAVGAGVGIMLSVGANW